MWQAGMKAGYKYIADLNALNAEQYLAARQITYPFCWRFLKLTEMPHTVIYDLPRRISCCFFALLQVL